MLLKAKTIISKFLDVRNYTEEICKPLKPEDYVPQPVVYISPPKWHLAHTTWFFEQFLLKSFATNYKEFDPDFGFLFNSYYNNVGDRVLRAERGNLTRPVLSDVLAYRAYVNEHMVQLMDEMGDDPSSIMELILLGLNHEQQHQELLITDLKYILGHNPIFPVYKNDGSLVSDIVKNDAKWIPVPEGVRNIGFDGEGFHFDNEKGSHKVYINPFQISSELVSNGMYLNFIEDGGYEDFNLWLDEGWAWKNENKISSPLYWHLKDGGWFYYTLGGAKELDPNAILSHISYYEANAFANWAGMRLPTEFEWEIASQEFDYGQRWEWTQSAYLPYPGFKAPKGAVGEYNGKFMINQMVLRGSSVATSRGHSRPTYRNFFHPHLQWQFSGIRLAK